MLRIQRIIDSDRVVLILSGRIGAAELWDLRNVVLAEQAATLGLDLTEVRLVDADVVRFLVQCEARGIRLAQCPAYIREWMAREDG